MSLDDVQLRGVERRITEAVRTVERDLDEPVELWARVEHRLDRSGRRRRWVRLTLAAAAVAAAAASLSVAVWRDGDRQSVSTDSVERPLATIEAMCRSLLAMRRDVVPLPESFVGLEFTIERMQSAYDAAAGALDAVAPSELPPSMRAPYDGSRSIFEVDARRRLHQAGVDIDDGLAAAARQSASGALAMMVVALEELHDAGIGACDPSR